MKHTRKSRRLKRQRRRSSRSMNRSGRNRSGGDTDLLRNYQQQYIVSNANYNDVNIKQYFNSNQYNQVQAFNKKLYDDTMTELNRLAKKYGIIPQGEYVDVFHNVETMGNTSSNGPDNVYVIDMINFIDYFIRERNLKRTYYGNFKQTVVRPMSRLFEPITNYFNND